MSQEYVSEYERKCGDMKWRDDSFLPCTKNSESRFWIFRLVLGISIPRLRRSPYKRTKSALLVKICLVVKNNDFKRFGILRLRQRILYLLHKAVSEFRVSYTYLSTESCYGDE